jgi:uncharacterized protein
VTTTWTRALVTGASGGIGEAMARRLAADGTSLVVVARSADRLEAVATEVRQRNGVEVEVLPADLEDAGGLATVEDRLRAAEAPVDLLVNNAGYGRSGPFVDGPVEVHEGQVRLNVVALLRLTHAALPGMIARGSGTVLNVSSVAGFQPLPFSAVYAATKAFVTSFSEAVAEEVRGTGVTVTAVCPGFTRTGFQERSGLEEDGGDRGIPRFAWMTADAVAGEALSAAARGVPVSVPGAGYKALVAASRPAPMWLRRRVTAVLTRRGRD